MALTTTTSDHHRSPPFQIHLFPQEHYIDALRWLPQISAFHRHIAIATFNSDTSTSSLQTLAFTPNPPNITLQATQLIQSRITSLKTLLAPQSSKPLIAASTFNGSLLFLTADLLNGSLDFEFRVPEEEKRFCSGPALGIDLSENGHECVSVGKDGKINLVSIGSGERGSYKRGFDSNGLVSYTTVKWASPSEFVTGGLGFTLHWWDQRRPGGPVSQFKPNWTSGTTSGLVHSIDIHPSRKHTCLAGGSVGTVFAWDLRWQQQPIILSGAGTDAQTHSLSESDVWEVQYDNYTHSSNRNFSTSHILPAMICSEDGILAVMEQNEEPVELLAEPCAINNFDIDRQNPSDVICSLEWESIAVLTRS